MNMDMNLNMSSVSYSFIFVGNPVLKFLQKPIYLLEFSAFSHLILLFGVILALLHKVFLTADNIEHLNHRNLWYNCKPVFFSSLALSLYNMVLFCLSYFYWYNQSVWSDEKVATLADSALRTLSWLLISVYLYAHRFSHSSGKKFPLPLRIWWGFYLALSIYCFVIDMVKCLENKCVSTTRVLVSDFVYVTSGIFFCFAVFFRKLVVSTREDSSTIQEPFLNNNENSDPNRETSSPYLKAGLFSTLMFSWVGSLMSKGYKKSLVLEDIPLLSGKENVSESYVVFRGCLDSSTSESDNDKNVTTMRLVKALIFHLWQDILLTGFLCLLYTLASYVGPYLINTFVQYLNGRREYKNEGYLLVSAFFIAKLVECFTQRHWIFRLQAVGIRVKSVLIESIYSKTLTISCLSKKDHTSGEMINLMSVDAEKVGEFSWYMHDPWTIILQVILALMILYKSLGGVASIVALVATVVVMLANLPLPAILDKYEEKLMESKDKRMKATSEILKNMRILKLQAWEMKFLSKIIDLRIIENGWLKKYLYTLSIISSVFWCAPTFVSVVTFGTCILLGILLESGKILSALATFKILQEPIHVLPDLISAIIQTKVSLDRIASFLCLDDLEPVNSERLHRASTSEFAIKIDGGNFSWDPSASQLTLQDINLQVYHGMTIAVCGVVGSGKSTLLSCILGEVPRVSGALRLSGSKAYVPQSPWIQSGTIMDNILFGQEMDHEKYDRILEACSLKQDLANLSFRDQTIIGERGINLSGGQKQRLQIARALYQNADIYLLDDPFSAVDAQTSNHLFKECLLGLLRSKTVIYVTHQVEFLSNADLILVMRHGRIAQAGKYDDIIAPGTDFIKLVGAHEQALFKGNSLFEHRIMKPVVDDEEQCNTNGLEEKRNVSHIEKIHDETQQLVQQEEREKGKVGFSVYWKYITTVYGGALVPFILLAQVLFQTLQILSNYWMALATPVSPDAPLAVSGNTLILVYLALAIGSSLCVLLRSTLHMNFVYKTATSLFNKMHSCIFRAPMSFFDATPSGRILNRASTDQSAVDMTIPNKVGVFAFTLIQLLGIIVVMSQVSWQVFVIFIPVTAISLWYQQYYIRSARELCRLIGVTKAPVIQHFAETISGTTVIRSFDQERRFCETSMELVNDYSRPTFYNNAMMEWLYIRLDLLSSITFATSLIILISISAELVDPRIAGLSLTYGLTLNMIQGSFIWNRGNMENKIISVERILQYTCISSEPPLIIEENRPDPSWPSHGEILVKDLQIRYAPHMPLVLRGIMCTFHGGKKTGIVGRTGCGKSTLVQALFRIVDPAAGQILLDGINISSIGLHDLRSRLSIIPQDPTMFEGTVRSNLDPLEEYSDEQIWEALDKCQLGDQVRNKEGKLDSIVTENGENWSMGQRQLVCLGRVLLKKSKVLVLDEATASVDTATDNLIQKTLNEHFSDSTVIIVAHRITSVIDSDMVVLLRQGLVEEWDSPLRLRLLSSLLSIRQDLIRMQRAGGENQCNIVRTQESSSRVN